MKKKEHDVVVEISNLALAKQIKEAMQDSTELLTSCYTWKTQEIDIFVRGNQMQQVSYPKVAFETEANGIRKSTYDMMIDMVYKLVKDCKEPFGQCLFEIRYEAGQEGTDFSNFSIKPRVTEHFKRH